jgi:hypothetical protein
MWHLNPNRDLRNSCYLSRDNNDCHHHRETVLKRDGTGVVTASDCSASSGTWISPYDNEKWTAASDVDIDHMVPLANAWIVSPEPSNHGGARVVYDR